MNYIGSKHRLSSFLDQSIKSVVGDELSNQTFCDMFAGSGAVGKLFKSQVKLLQSNDIERYSYVLNRNYIGNNIKFDYHDNLDELNSLTSDDKGFIYQNYCLGSGSERQYFSDENGKKIDAIRQTIEQWFTSQRIDEDEYYFLLASLIESSDKIANTASVYGAHLKHLKPMAKLPLLIEPALFEPTPTKHEVYQEDSNNLIDKIEGDILYLDPPYNLRQYGNNYHLLNTIAKYDQFEPKGKTGVRRDYFRSHYARTNHALPAFEELIKRANYRYIFVSYNNEGLIPEEKIKEVMSRYGKYDRISKSYKRFRADKEEMRNHRAKQTQEHLHILEKQ